MGGRGSQVAGRLKQALAERGERTALEAYREMHAVRETLTSAAYDDHHHPTGNSGAGGERAARARSHPRRRDCLEGRMHHRANGD